MNGINGNKSLSIDLGKLGIFGSIATQEGDHGRTTIRMKSGSKFGTGGVYSSTNLADRLFRSDEDKKANNAVRTKLIENLAAAFGFGGVQRNAGTGEVTFSEQLMDQLEKTLGKGVLSRGDFGIGRDGKVGSGSPLTERRITTIVNRVHELCVAGAEGRLRGAAAVLQNQMTMSRIEFDDPHVLSGVDTARIVSAFKAAGGTMEAVSTVGKLKQLVEQATGRSCHVVCQDPQSEPSLLDAQLANPRLFESVFVAGDAQSDELRNAAEAILEARNTSRTSLKKAVTILPLPSHAERAEAFNFGKADLFVDKDNVSDVRKNPCGRGTVVVDYPDDVKGIDDTLKAKFAAATGLRAKAKFGLFFERQFVFVIGGEELSSRNTTKADFLSKVEAFFGDDARMESAIDELFGGYLTLMPYHPEQAKTGLCIGASAPDCLRPLQKFSLSRNGDGSFRVTSEFCFVGPKNINMFKPVRFSGTEVDVPICLKRKENAPEPESSYISYRMSFDVRKTDDGLEVTGVGERPASMKFCLDDGYVNDDKYTNGLPADAEFL